MHHHFIKTIFLYLKNFGVFQHKDYARHLYRLSKLTLAATIITLVGLLPVQAEITNQLAEMPEVVVTDEPAKNFNQHQITRPDIVLEGSELRRKRGSNIGDTLSQSLGVSSSSFGPGAGRPIIRGLDGPRIRVLESGIGTGDLSIVSPDHVVATNSMNASRIEIFRGPSALLYGSGTSGGVVNVIKQRIPDRLFKSPQGNVEGRFNSATEERSGTFNANGSFKQLSWNFEGFKQKSNNIKIPGRADKSDPNSKRGTVKNSAIDSGSLSAGGSFVGERGFVGISISRLENRYGIPGPEGAKIDMGQTRYGVAGELDDPIKGFKQVKLRLNYNDYHHDELESSGEISTRFKNNELEGRVELLHEPLANWQGVLGVQFQQSDFRITGTEAFLPSTQSHSVGLFVVEKRQWNRFQFELGGRIERAERNPNGSSLSSRDFNLYSISAGGTWEFTEGYKLDLSTTRGQRAPTAVALYADGFHVATNTFEIGDAGITRETSNNIDFGLHKTSGAITGKINLFFNQIQDYVFLQSLDSNNDGMPDRINDEGMLDDNGSFLVQRFSQTGARFYGLEIETMIELLPDALNMRLFTDIVYGKLRHDGNIPRLTPQRFGVELDYKWRSWSSNLNVTRVSRQQRVAQLETETSGYTLLNTEVSFNVKGPKSTRYTIFLQGRNLLDSDIRVHTSFLKTVAPLPGRAIVSGIRGEF